MAEQGSDFFQVNVPGVGTVQFPAGMSQQDMAAAIEKNFAPELHAARNREDVSAGMGLRGVPIAGAFVPQAEAAIRSAVQPLTGAGAPGETYGERYATNLRRQNAQYRLAEEEQPALSTATKIGFGSLPFLAAGGLPVAGRMLGVAPGMTTGGRVAAGGISGGVISAADAAARGEDVGKAGLIGTGLGVALPAIGAAAGQAIRGEGPGAVQQLAGRIGRESVGADFPNQADIGPRMAELGPHGFAGEAGANTRATLQGLVTEEGPARERVTQAFNQRAEGRPQRIEDAITAAFGPRQDIAELSIGERMAQGIESSPLYDAFRTTQVHPTPAIRELLPVLQEDGLLGMAIHRMRLEGRPVMENVFSTANVAPGGPGAVAGRALGPSTAGPMGPTTEAWDYVKRAIDARIGTAARAGDRDAVRIYTGLKRRVDDAIANSNPEAAAVWRQARDTWGSREAIITARDEGQKLWDRGVRRDQLRQELMDMSMPERLAFREGARDALAERIDATVNGDTQVARMLRAPANRDKAMMLAHDQRSTAELLNTVDREAQSADFHRQLLQNSQTAIKQAAAARLKPPERNLGWMRNLDFGKPASWIPWIERGATNFQAARDLTRYQQANDIIAQQLLTQGQPGQQSLLRMLQPPVTPPPHAASRIGAYGAQSIAPFLGDGP